MIVGSKVLVAGLALATSASAGAQETAEPWDHAYVGFHGGVAEFRTNRRPGALNENSTLTAQAPSFGAQVGRRWQDGNIIAGLEIDADFPVDAETANLFQYRSGVFPGTDIKLQARSAVKGSIGFSAGPLLAYGVGGLQVSRLRFGSVSAPLGDPAARTVSTSNVAGFVVGGGLGHRLSGAMNVEFEATHSDIGGNESPRSRGVVLRINRAL